MLIEKMKQRRASLTKNEVAQLIIMAETLTRTIQEKEL
jgi:hypothetical protein